MFTKNQLVKITVGLHTGRVGRIKMLHERTCIIKLSPSLDNVKNDSYAATALYLYGEFCAVPETTTLRSVQIHGYLDIGSKTHLPCTLWLSNGQNFSTTLPGISLEKLRPGAVVTFFSKNLFGVAGCDLLFSTDQLRTK